MKFAILTGEITFKRTVTVRIPSATKVDGYDDHSFKMLFRHMPDAEAEAGMKALEGLVGDALRVKLNDQDVAVAAGWEDMIGEDGKPVPYSETLLREALGNLYFRAAYRRAYQDGVAGEGRRGN
ncbi:hypothetical protein [Methylobrevis pamukkalensis]|uniref:Uncharacterized protein n=1 Tax=Methylobrevis pamukkalensis TaxID=1439726 RepID=A0A1E3H4D8_9HYPH|nr:hypothetical protein [Methylobrevis pamukkalensis]ODN71174.1 hypothetical protein A6302_01463 [Methylobrevis pamukkalensis]